MKTKYYIALTSRGIVLAKDLPNYLMHNSEAWYKHYTETFNYTNPEQKWEEDIKQALDTASVFKDQELGRKLIISVSKSYFEQLNKIYPVDLSDGDDDLNKWNL